MHHKDAKMPPLSHSDGKLWQACIMYLKFTITHSLNFKWGSSPTFFIHFRMMHDIWMNKKIPIAFSRCIIKVINHHREFFDECILREIICALSLLIVWADNNKFSQYFSIDELIGWNLWAFATLSSSIFYIFILFSCSSSTTRERNAELPRVRNKLF
jgi:hypothetical protein